MDDIYVMIQHRIYPDTNNDFTMIKSFYSDNFHRILFGLVEDRMRQYNIKKKFSHSAITIFSKVNRGSEKDITFMLFLPSVFVINQISN